MSGYAADTSTSDPMASYHLFTWTDSNFKLHPSPKIQAYISTEDGERFDVSLSQGDVSFKIIELTKDEIERLISDIKEQVYLLKEAYKEEGESG